MLISFVHFLNRQWSEEEWKKKSYLGLPGGGRRGGRSPSQMEEFSRCPGTTEGRKYMIKSHRTGNPAAQVTHSQNWQNVFNLVIKNVILFFFKKQKTHNYIKSNKFRKTVNSSLWNKVHSQKPAKIIKHTHTHPHTQKAKLNWWQNI